MSQEEWRDARLKKALDSAPDADARPADAVREAILHKARLMAGAAGAPAKPTPRAWRWLGSLAAVGALAVVLVGGRQLFLASPAAHEEAAPQVAMAPAREESAKVAEAPAPASAPVIVADASPPPNRKAAVQVKKPVVVAAAPLPPPTVVAQATSPPPPPPTAAPAAPAAPVAPAAAPARADPAWTVLRIATTDGPVLLRREQLSEGAAGRLSRLLAAADEQQQLRTQLADERQASKAQAFARSPAAPGLLRIELLRDDQPVGNLFLPPGDPLRQEIEAAAAAKPASAP